LWFIYQIQQFDIWWLGALTSTKAIGSDTNANFSSFNVKNNINVANL
jgi:hypothetical protein